MTRDDFVDALSSLAGQAAQLADDIDDLMREAMALEVSDKEEEE